MRGDINLCIIPNGPEININRYYEYPKDKEQIAKLSLEELQEWYGSLMNGGVVGMNSILQDVDFQRFWSKTYLQPLKWKRRWFHMKRLLHLSR